MAMTTLLRVGIVGVGRMGRRHAENLACRVPGRGAGRRVQPDRRGARLGARRARRARASTSDYDELLRRAGTSTRCSSSRRTRCIPAQIIAALAAGKHVFCEKPLSLDLDDCLAVEAEAAKHPRAEGDDRLRAPLRRELPGRAGARSPRARSAGRSWCARRRATRTTRPASSCASRRRRGGIFVDMSVHDIDLARWLLGVAEGAARVLDRHHRRARGPRRLRRRRQRRGDLRVRRRPHGLLLRVADDGARPRDGDRGRSAPTGRLVIGRDGRLHQVEIADAHGIRTLTTPTFYERFADAFLRELDALRRLRAPRPRAGADAARRDRGDAHRHRAAHVARRAARGGAVTDRLASSPATLARRRRAASRHRGFGKSATLDEGPPRRRHRDGPRGRALHPRGDRAALSRTTRCIGEEEGGGGGRAAVDHRPDRRHRQLRARHPALLRVDRLPRARRADASARSTIPRHDWLYSAARGEGAWRDGERLARQPLRRHRRGDRRVRLVDAPPGRGLRRPGRRACWTPGGGDPPRRLRARSGSPTSRPAASRRYASCTSTRGTARPASCWCARPGGFTNDFFAGDGPARRQPADRDQRRALR